MEILKDIKNDLFEKRNIEVMVEAEKNPGVADSTKFMASKFNAPAENIVINNIKGQFGKKAFLIAASIYDSKEAKEKNEPKPKKKKGEEGEAPATAPTAPAPAPAEKPAPAKEVKETEKKTEGEAEKTVEQPQINKDKTEELPKKVEEPKPEEKKE